MANDSGERSPTTPMGSIKDIALPITMVIALLGNALIVGVSWGRSGQRLDGVATQLSKIEAALDKVIERQASITSRQVELEVDMRDLKRQNDATRMELLKLQDYTEGRISHLQYRKGR